MVTSLTTGFETPALSADSEHVPYLQLATALLEVAIQARRNGTLGELVRQRPKVARWMMRRQWSVMRGTAGSDFLSESDAIAADWLLTWLVTQLRPDAKPSLEGIADDAWLVMTGWRAMLGTASFAGLVVVPDFPRHYRRRSGESPLDNLCGLWGVGPSTFYRLLEKARHSMAQVLMDTQLDGARRLSLREFVTGELQKRLGLSDELGFRQWCSRQASLAKVGTSPVSQLWHLLHASDLAGFIAALRINAASLALEPETTPLIARVLELSLDSRTQVDLWLARAALDRTRGSVDGELRACEEARRVAQLAQDPLLLGIVHSELGKFYEPRDTDRAFALYQDSADFLSGIGPESGDVGALEHFVTTYVRLAWLYLLRNDSRSKAVLDRAEALRDKFKLPDEVLGRFEQVRAEYWHRAGELKRSLEHNYRALNIFERLGDLRSVLAINLNLVHVNGQLGNLPSAIACANVIFNAPDRITVEPALLASTHLNLGAAQFWAGDMDAAIAQYQAALSPSLKADLRVHAFRARYNLAEAHYTRFRESANRQDEETGDKLVSEVLAASESESLREGVKSARHLKEDLLGRNKIESGLNRLLPGEDAVHFNEMSEIRQQRQLLAASADEEQRAQTHLVIARAYASIAAKEREAALALIQLAGLQDRFSTDLAELQQTFERGLTHEQNLQSTWKKQAADLLDDIRRAALVTYLLSSGSVNKSRYAELGAVSPATASKHLAMLTERGLLVQLGKGPSTRYELPPLRNRAA
jgi:tetratricopeptide (TPR) repeat protein